MTKIKIEGNMKYVWIVLGVICVGLIFLFCPIKNVEKPQYLRIHIRANSNSVLDQNVKYKVKDEIVETLIPILSEVKTFEDAKRKVEENLYLVEWVANKVLSKEGFNYKSSASLKKEYFPTRSYDNVTLKEGQYDSLIVNLGSGEGNNWWCVVFPAFCFTQTQKSDNIEYISLIWEIIKSIT